MKREGQSGFCKGWLLQQRLHCQVRVFSCGWFGLGSCMWPHVNAGMWVMHVVLGDLCYGNTDPLIYLPRGWDASGKMCLKSSLACNSRPVHLPLFYLLSLSSPCILTESHLHARWQSSRPEASRSLGRLLGNPSVDTRTHFH